MVDNQQYITTKVVYHSKHDLVTVKYRSNCDRHVASSFISLLMRWTQLGIAGVMCAVTSARQVRRHIASHHTHGPHTHTHTHTSHTTPSYSNSVRQSNARLPYALVRQTPRTSASTSTRAKETRTQTTITNSETGAQEDQNTKAIISNETLRV